jgi:hypothetical protein
MFTNTGIPTPTPLRGSRAELTGMGIADRVAGLAMAAVPEAPL